MGPYRNPDFSSRSIFKCFAYLLIPLLSDSTRVLTLPVDSSLFWLSISLQVILMTTIVPVAALNETLHGAKIHVRVIRTWQGRANDAPVFFVLLDAHGDAIQGKIAAKDFRKIYGRFAQGKFCELSKFEVRTAPPGFRAVSKAIALSLSAYADVYPLSPPLPDIPAHYFELSQLEDVGVDKASSDCIIDVVARIVGFRPVETVQSQGGSVRVMTLFIANERDFPMDVAVWDSFVDKFVVADLIPQSQNAPVVVACNSLQLRKYQLRWTLKTFAGSQFHFDETIPELAAFKSSLPSGLPPIFHDATLAAQCMQGSALALAPRVEPRRVTLLQLKSIDSTFDADIFQCVIDIVDVLTRYDWYYGGCPFCNRKLADPEKHPFCNYQLCSSYKARVVPLPWYRFTILAKDASATSRFVLLGLQAEAVLGAQISTLLTEQKASPHNAPATLLSIIGKRFLFSVSGREVNLYSRYQSYTVQGVGPVPAEHAPLAIEAEPPSLPVGAAENQLQLSAMHDGPFLPSASTPAASASASVSATPPDAELHLQPLISAAVAAAENKMDLSSSTGKRPAVDALAVDKADDKAARRRLNFSAEEGAAVPSTEPKSFESGTKEA